MMPLKIEILVLLQVWMFSEFHYKSEVWGPGWFCFLVRHISVCRNEYPHYRKIKQFCLLVC